jgi:integrase
MTENITFCEQSQRWLADLAARKRKPASPATLHAFGSYVRRLKAMIGHMKLADINNGALKQLVQRLDKEKLSAKTINELVAVVKQVVGSLLDEDTGEPLIKREWSARFIDCPTVTKQKQPCVTAKDVDRCIKEATSDQEAMLYAILAGTGLRIAEALAIRVKAKEEQTWWDAESQAIFVRSSLYNGQEIYRLKTAAAKRTVDLDPRLSELVESFVELKGIGQRDYLFQSRTGGPMHVNTARSRLVVRGIQGFHNFRRFRITRLRELGVAEDILRFWIGHEGRGITDRYSKLGENAELRREWSIYANLGFELPEIDAVASAPTTSHAPQPVAAAPKVSESVQPQPTYIAEDNDLDRLFYSAPEEAA